MARQEQRTGTKLVKGYMVNIDVNLTGQVAANLIQNPIMLVGAGALGGFVTGLMTLIGVWITQKHAAEREEENRQYKLKKQAYFDFLDQVMAGRRLFEGYEKVENTPGIEQHKKWDLIEEWMPRFDPVKLKVQVCGSDKVKALIEPWQSASFGKTERTEFAKRTKEVIDAMREDLIRKF